MVQNLTPSLTTSTWSSDFVGQRSRAGGIASIIGLNDGPPVASSHGLGTLYSETNAIIVNNSSGQSLPMASSHGAGNLSCNVESASSNFLGQDLPVGSSHGPGNI